MIISYVISIMIPIIPCIMDATEPHSKEAGTQAQLL